MLAGHGVPEHAVSGAEMDEARIQQDDLEGTDLAMQSDRQAPLHSEWRGIAKYFYGTEKARSRRPASRAEQRAVALGWFSLGLGFVQLAAPRLMKRSIGAGNSSRGRATMMACGVREIISGIGILTQPRPSSMLWARVAGDLVDLALLARASGFEDADRRRLAQASMAALGVTVLDVKTALDLSRERQGQDIERDGLHVKRAITVNTAPEVAYQYWRDLENLPKFMAHLEQVTVNGDRSYWRAKGPLGMAVEWEAEIVLDQPGELIRWQSMPGARVPNHGEVRFATAPGKRGTEVSVELVYEPPGGAVAQLVLKLFGEEPAQQVQGDLRRFKQLVETGEVLHSDATVHKGLHAARPAKQTRRLP